MKLIDGHQQLQQVSKSSAGWQAARTLALQELEQIDIPTRKQEDWKYINFQDLKGSNFQSSYAFEKRPSIAAEIIVKKKLNPNFYNLVFINGFLSAALSPLTELQNELEIYQMDKIISGQDTSGEMIVHSVERLLKTCVQGTPTFFDKLNHAFVGQGIVLKLRTNSVLKKPLNIVHFTTLESKLPLSTQFQLFLELGSGSKATFIESYFGLETEKYFINNRTEIHLNQNANLQYLRQQSDASSAFHIARTRAYLEAGSQFHSLSYQDGAQIGRHSLDVYHLGKNSSSIINGIYLCDQNRTLDNHTLIDHVVGECQSTQLYKGIVAGRSKAIFNGRVQIRHGSQKASSEQLNNNLLLSSEAEVDSKPELDIYADDVKAAHGSTIGQLNEEEIFYFESRAIPRKIAIELLSKGFVYELIHKLEDQAAAKWLGAHLDQKMKALNV